LFQALGDIGLPGYIFGDEDIKAFDLEARLGITASHMENGDSN
jgi:hypothetical protein